MFSICSMGRGYYGISELPTAETIEDANQSDELKQFTLLLKNEEIMV